jgi:hypothetical protein
LNLKYADKFQKYYRAPVRGVFRQNTGDLPSEAIVDKKFLAGMNGGLK